MANNRADDRTSVGRLAAPSEMNEDKPRPRSSASGTTWPERAHPHSDVVLDKWTLAIKSIRRDMALSRDTSRCVAPLFMCFHTIAILNQSRASGVETPGTALRFIESRYPACRLFDLPAAAENRFVNSRQLFP